MAIGRKNLLFAAVAQAATRHVVFYTLVETCHRHDVNTWPEIKAAMKAVGTRSVSEIVQLSAHQGKLRHSEAHRLHATGSDSRMRGAHTLRAAHGRALPPQTPINPPSTSTVETGVRAGTPIHPMQAAGQSAPLGGIFPPAVGRTVT